jgi:tetratricopeptide (TPR) repeat protein
LEYDSTFASPYIRIAGMHQLRYGANKLKYAGSLDSSLLYINKGLLLDNQAEEGYFLRGFYYISLGQFDKAIEEFDKAIDINPNYSEAYRGKGYVYATRKVDYIKSIENFNMSLQLLRGGNLPYALRELKWAYGLAGFNEKSMELEREAFILDGDSLTFLLQRAWYERSVRKDTMAAMETLFKAYALDSTAIRALLHMGNMYRMLGQYKESYTYYSKCVARMEELNSSLMWAMSNMIYVFQQVGETEKANYFIHKSIQYYESIPGEKRSQQNVIRLARLRALNGDAEDALELLSNLAQQDCHIPSARSFEESFVWDKIRNEPEFMPIMHEINAKRQAEYERVRQWLEENDLL